MRFAATRRAGRERQRIGSKHAPILRQKNARGSTSLARPQTGQPPRSGVTYAARLVRARTGAATNICV
jgi:hypothetical protein